MKIRMIISSWQVMRFARLHDSSMLEKISFALIFKEVTKIRTHIEFTCFKKRERKEKQDDWYQTDIS